jgi:hypothetical protein
MYLYRLQIKGDYQKMSSFYHPAVTIPNWEVYKYFILLPYCYFTFTQILVTKLFNLNYYTEYLNSVSWDNITLNFDAS